MRKKYERSGVVVRGNAKHWTWLTTMDRTVRCIRCEWQGAQDDFWWWYKRWSGDEVKCKELQTICDCEKDMGMVVMRGVKSPRQFSWVRETARWTWNEVPRAWDEMWRLTERHMVVTQLTRLPWRFPRVSQTPGWWRSDGERDFCDVCEWQWWQIGEYIADCHGEVNGLQWKGVKYRWSVKNVMEEQAIMPAERISDLKW